MGSYHLGLSRDAQVSCDSEGRNASGGGRLAERGLSLLLKPALLVSTKNPAIQIRLDQNPAVAYKEDRMPLVYVFAASKMEAQPDKGLSD